MSGIVVVVARCIVVVAASICIIDPAVAAVYDAAGNTILAQSTPKRLNWDIQRFHCVYNGIIFFLKIIFLCLYITYHYIYYLHLIGILSMIRCFC